MRRIPGPGFGLDQTRRIPVLTLIEGDDTKIGAMYLVKEIRFRIGRDTENHLVLGSETVSRFHAEILTDENGFWIEDHESGIGTFVDGKSISGQKELEPGALIQIGRYSLRFGL